MTSRKLVACAAVAGLAVGAMSSKVAQAGQVVISGATLFVDFFKAPGSTNDYIDVDGNGVAGSLGSLTVQQLCPGLWDVVVRGVGSGNGLKDLMDWGYPSPLGTPVVYDLVTGKPTDAVYNRVPWITSGVFGGAANPLNVDQSQCPVTQENVAIGVMDVPPSWFVQAGAIGDADWNKHPGQAGYGYNSVSSWDSGQTNNLLVLQSGRTGTPFNFDQNNDKTIYTYGIAWVPISFISNRGTGLENVDMSDLQYLFTTGRRSNGENLIAATRDIFSGTRNGSMNSIGLNPSFGRGDNLGSQTSSSSAPKLGPNFQATNLDGSGLMEDAVYNARLAVGYTGLAGTSRASGDTVAGKYEIINIRKDIADGTNYVRPSVWAVVNNANVNNGWQIGGAETMATIGDAFAVEHGTYPMAAGHLSAQQYIRNVVSSILDFVAVPSSSTNSYMPGEQAATQYTLTAGIAALPTDADPSTFVANPDLVADLQDYLTYNTSIPMPSFGSVNTAGKVGIRNDSNKFVDSSGVQLAPGANLSKRNRIAGDFNYDLQRNMNDIAKMMQAVNNKAAFEAGNNNGGDGYVCLDILGDFNADTLFDAADVRYFADGLAIDTVSGHVARKAAFMAVDNQWQILGHSNNYFGTTLATSKPYTAGASRGDVTGTGLVNQPGARPVADNVINQLDINYVKANFGSWSTLSEAIKIDLSCDMNDDMVVDVNDVSEMYALLGTHLGDIDLNGTISVSDLQALVLAWAKAAGQSGYNANADIDNSKMVNIGDLQLLVANWGL